MASLDDIDRKILDILQKNGRTRRNNLADAVDLSLPSVSDRLRKLEQAGIITGYAALVDAKKLGRDVTAFVVIQMDSSKRYHNFIEHATACDEVLECHAITGDGSHILKIRIEDMSRLEKLLAKIQSWPGVTGTKTQLVLSTSKETTAIQLNHRNHQL
jgi:Lrp/AsnC family leucine-responsive transcriptional regulator